MLILATDACKRKTNKLPLVPKNTSNDRASAPRGGIADGARAKRVQAVARISWKPFIIITGRRLPVGSKRRNVNKSTCSNVTSDESFSILIVAEIPRIPRHVLILIGRCVVLFCQEGVG